MGPNHSTRKTGRMTVTSMHGVETPGRVPVVNRDLSCFDPPFRRQSVCDVGGYSGSGTSGRGRVSRVGYGECVSYESFYGRYFIGSLPYKT